MRPVRHKHLLQGAEPDMILNMQGENDFEVEYSIDQLVLVVQKGQEVHYLWLLVLCFQ
jgi:hypothetical protein